MGRKKIKSLPEADDQYDQLESESGVSDQQSESGDLIGLLKIGRDKVVDTFSAMDTTKILNLLDELEDEESSEEYHDAPYSLEQIDRSSDNYFIKLRIRQKRRKPLDNYSVSSKRALLKSNSHDLGQLGINPSEIDNLGEDRITELFDRYRDEAREFFEWHQRSDLHGKYIRQGGYLNEEYQITPTAIEREGMNRGEPGAQKFIDNCTFTRLSPSLGVVYDPDGKIDKIFRLDPRITEKTQEESKQYGSMVSSYLQWFLEKIEETLHEGSTRPLLIYIHVRSQLPESFVSAFENKFNIQIPDQLKRSFDSIDEFKDACKPYEETLISQFRIDQRAMALDLKNWVEATVSDKTKRQRETHADCSMPQGSLLGLINYVETTGRSGRVHFSIARYLYDRKSLPSELVKEFEDKFKISIPSGLQHFSSFDDYLSTPPERIERFLSACSAERYEAENDPEFREMNRGISMSKLRAMTIWLGDRLKKLYEKIDQSKPKPAELTLDETINEEMLGAKILSDQEKERLLKDYEFLATLEMRDEIERNFGIRLEDFSLRTQLQFLNFLKTKTQKGAEEVRLFLNEAADDADRKNRVNVFLALETEPGMGEKIMRLNEALPQNDLQMLFSAYAAMADSAQQASQELYEQFQKIKKNKHVSRETIYQKLTAHSNQLLNSAYEKIHETKVDWTSLIRSFHHENETINTTRGVVGLLSREEVATLDLDHLPTVSVTGPIEAQFLNRPENRRAKDQILKAIRDTFPKGDDVAFERDFLSDPRAKLVISMCGEDVLAFYGLQQMPDGTEYIDWFIGNPDAPVKGLAEATMGTVLRRPHDHPGYYCVAKPHVKSFPIFVERADFVAFGGTDDGEYQHHYLRCRQLKKEENDRYAGKQLTPEQITEIQSVCAEPEKMLEYRTGPKGERLSVCKIEFKGVDHQTDIDENHAQGFIFKKIRELCAGNEMVMTRFIPDARNSHDKQAYYCVFEPSQLTTKAYQGLLENIHEFHGHGEKQVSQKAA